MSIAQREFALCLAEESLNNFLERLTWYLGDEGIDAQLGTKHAYRFRVEMEIVGADSGKIVHSEPINRGGKFFGGNWGKWLNKHRDK